MILLIFLSLVASADCKKVYGMMDEDNFWHESYEPKDGHQEVVLTSGCQYDPEAMEKIDDKWVMNKKRREAKFQLDKEIDQLKAEIKELRDAKGK